MIRSQEEFDYFDSLVSRVGEWKVFVFEVALAGVVLEGRRSGV
jgi:hypothetical protein